MAKKPPGEPDGSVGSIVKRLQQNITNVWFLDLAKVCEEFFGKPRQDGTSHKVYSCPWAGNPRVNIQPGKDGKAKAYQVRQVIQAIEKLHGLKGKYEDES